MSRRLPIFVFLSLLGSTTLAPAEDICGLLEEDFDLANKALASGMVFGLGDNSAPRATNRALNAVELRLRQLIAITQMQSHGCAVPKQLSGGAPYFDNAMKCHGDMISGRSTAPIPSCDYDTWTRR